MRDAGDRATAAVTGQVGLSEAGPGSPAGQAGLAGLAGLAGSLADPGGPRTIASELDDALYYLRHDCVPCAERHFDLARGLGATEDMISRVRAQAGEPSPG